MDDVVNRLARELSDAIAAAVADDARVEACRERARAAGFEMKVIARSRHRLREPVESGRARQGWRHHAKTRRAADRRDFDISANDKRFLRSLRIAADEAQEKEVEVKGEW